MSVKTIIGQAAMGNNFYPRPEITSLFWNKIKNGNNILISAPRRVGKTSLMKHFRDEPINNYELIYIITESINNSNEFFKKVFKEILNLLNTKDRFKTQINLIFKSKQLKSIMKNGISIDHVTIDYFSALNNVLKLLQLNDEKIILLIDEFSQTIENIIQDEGERIAILFLEQNREIRQLKEVENKVQFVYAGSIGLENIAGKINATNTINDLYNFNVPPLSEEQAKELIIKIIEGSNLAIDNKTIMFILEKIEWYLPYYIQIIIDEIDKINDIENRPVDEKDVNNAFEKALTRRNYFEHWFTRLRKAYKSEEFNFVKTLLNHASEHGRISKIEIFDMAVQHAVEIIYIDIMNSLKHDGYLEPIDANNYRFTSPLLRAWWKQNISF